MMNNFEKFRANERVVEVVKPGFLANVIPSWIWIFLIGGITTASVVLLIFLSWPLFARLAVGISIAVVLILVTRFLITIYANTLVLTNRRLIQNKRKGFFHTSRTEWHYEQIYRVRFVVNGLIAKLANSGYLKIEPLGGNHSVIIGPISQPARIQNLILELQREYIKYTRMGYFNPILQENRQESFQGNGSELSGTLSYGELLDFVRKIMETEKEEKKTSV